MNAHRNNCAEIALVFSALDSAVAGEVENRFRDAGYIVISNAGAHRMAEDVPLIIPEVNPHQLLHGRRPDGGIIITNPNCCAIPLTLSLAPLEKKWGIEAAVVSTWRGRFRRRLSWGKRLGHGRKCAPTRRQRGAQNRPRTG